MSANNRFQRTPYSPRRTGTVRWLSVGHTPKSFQRVSLDCVIRTEKFKSRRQSLAQPKTGFEFAISRGDKTPLELFNAGIDGWMVRPGDNLEDVNHKERQELRLTYATIRYLLISCPNI